MRVTVHLRSGNYRLLDVMGALYNYLLFLTTHICAKLLALVLYIMINSCGTKIHPPLHPQYINKKDMVGAINCTNLGFVTDLAKLNLMFNS